MLKFAQMNYKNEIRKEGEPNAKRMWEGVFK